MKNFPEEIIGGEFRDDRGLLQYNNSLSFFDFKRFYLITAPHQKLIRAWQGHQKESKLFTVLEGSFSVHLVSPNDWLSPEKNISSLEYNLTKGTNVTLFIPGGFYIGFRNESPYSRLLVHSDYSLKQSLEDDFRLPAHYWDFWNLKNEK